MKRAAMVALLVLFGEDARAQVGCPPGYFPIVQGPTGQEVQTCVPEGDAGRDAAGSGSALPPPARWENRWGAIATDGKGRAGIVVDMTSERAARKGAVAECKARGGNGCEVALTYHNQCAAVASNEEASFMQSAAYEEDAKKAAMDKCSLAGSKCWIYYSGCSLPMRVE